MGWSPTTAILLLILLSWFAPIVRGQQLGAEDDEAMVAAQARAQFTSQRRLRRALSTARRLMEQKEFSDAISVLQQYVLNASSDQMILAARDDGQALLSLKGEAQRLLMSLPAEERKNYQARYESEAKRLLPQGELDSRLALQQAAEIVARFPLTKVGQRTAYRIARLQLSNGQALLAATTLDRLRRLRDVSVEWEPMLSLETALAFGRGGRLDLARRTLVELKRATGDGPLKVGDQQFEFFDKPEGAVPWLVKVLQETSQLKGLSEESWHDLANKSAEQGKTQPLMLGQHRWEHTEFPSAGYRRWFRTIALNRSQRNHLVLPVSRPLVIDDQVVIRTLGGLRALDTKSGKVLWQAPSKEAAAELVQQRLADPDLTPELANLADTYLEQSTWLDDTSAGLSQHGDRVFAIVDSGIIQVARRIGLGAPQLPKSTEPRAFNRLVAHDARTGKIQWQVGGPAGENSLPVAEHFFLGVPTPLGEQLFVLAEHQGQVVLLCMRPENGHLNWSLPILSPEKAITASHLRRLAGARPHVAQGILVCPTSSQAVIGVDPVSRQLLWAYTYRGRYAGSPPQAPGIRFPFNRRLSALPRDSESRWFDSRPHLHRGRLIIAPRDSDELHCINVLNGQSQWKSPRNSALYVAGVFGDKVAVVGPSEVRSHQLQNGEPAWDPIAISHPAGLGSSTSSSYQLPLASGQLANLDLWSGKLVSLVRVSNEAGLGHLTSGSSGTLFSRSPSRLTALAQSTRSLPEIEASIKENPEDPEALLLRGVWRMQSGEVAKSLADLRLSYRLKKSEATRRQLADALLASFSASEKPEELAAEIEPLLRDADQRITFWSLMAAGKHAADSEAAIRASLRLLQLRELSQRSRPVSGDFVQREDVYTYSRIEQQLQEADEPERAAHQRALSAALQRAAEVDDVVLLERLARGVATTAPSIADEAAFKLIKRWRQPSDELKKQLLLLDLARLQRRETAGAASWQLARQAIADKRRQPARIWLGKLADEFSDVACNEQQTGRQLYAQFLKNEQLATDVTASVPMSNFAATQSSDDVAVMAYATPISVSRDAHRYYQGWKLETLRTREIAAYDSAGKERWRIAELDRRAYARNVDFYGDLMVVTFTDGFSVFDLLSRPDQPRRLWSRRVNAASLAPFVESSPSGVPKLIFLSGDVLIYRSGTQLHAADPVSGETLWNRGEIPITTQVAAGRSLILTLPPVSQRQPGQVIDVRTGKLVRKHDLIFPQFVQSFGDTILLRKQLTGGLELRCIEAVTEKVRWQRELKSKDSFVPIDDRTLAVWRSNGEFSVVEGDSGKTLIRATVQRDAKSGQPVVWRNGDHLFLTQRVTVGRDGQRRSTLSNGTLLVGGQLSGFDLRSGKQLWSREIDAHALDISQPQTWPMLVLLTRIYEPRNRAAPYRWHLLAIDKRTGQAVFDKEGDGNPRSARFIAAPSSHAYQIDTLVSGRTGRASTVRFKFQPAEPK